MSDERARRRLIGRAVLATVIPVGMVSATAQPALADPVIDAPPESGATPVASLPLLFPTAQPLPAAPSSTAVGPLAAEIIAESDLTQRLGEQVKALEDELAAAQARTLTARTAWERTDAILTAARARTGSTSPSPSGSVSGPPAPSGTATPSPTAASPTPGASGSAGPGATAGPTSTAGPTGSTDSAAETTATLSYRATAARAERAARTVLDDALTAEQEVAGRHGVVLQQFQRHQTALQTLTTRNASQLQEAQRARDAYEVGLAASRGASSSVDGLQASPEALEAVAFALRQLGKPYAWAEEGPDRYDCSGLMLASYLSVGVTLPRVANNQYGAGQPVLPSQLLPGDMIFFSTNPYDWRQIHHVAMYIGNNQVVQAPTFGDVVKISPIWWSEYFGATRIFPAVPLPGAAPAEPAPTATPTAGPTGSPSPSPSASTSASTGAPTSPTGTPSPSPSTSPSASATATQSPSPSPSAPTPSPTASASTAASVASSPSPSPTTDPSPTPAIAPTSANAQQARRRVRRR